jgi:hypothetical protein
MFVPKMRVLFSAMVLSVLIVGAGPARAAVEVYLPFYPRAEFRHEHGYYRTHDGRYYHYDRDTDGWHHGRNHREGLRRDHHREGKH